MELRDYIYSLVVQDTEPLPRLEDMSDVDDHALGRYLDELDLKRYALRARLRDASETQRWSERIWTFFALTQVCQKIRAEYYPL